MDDQHLRYQVVAARRLQWDNLVWQVPVLGLTAQAFLFVTALDGGSRHAKVVASLLSIMTAVLCVTLMARHRQGELADAHWLEAYERGPFRHACAWTLLQGQTRPSRPSCRFGRPVGAFLAGLHHLGWE